MIGHKFTSSGAIVLAVAPSATANDEYIVLVKYGDEYVTGHVAIHAMPSPAEWYWGTYFARQEAAVEDFRRLAGITCDIRITDAQVKAAIRHHVPKQATT